MQKEFVKAPELAKLGGVKTATVKFYSQLGLFDFYQSRKNAHKIFKVSSSLARLREIKDLQGRGYTIDLISKKFQGNI